MKHLLAITALATLLAACSSPTPPDTPPAPTTPPDVATTGFLTAYTEQDFTMTPPELRRFMQANPIIYAFDPVGDIAVPAETKVVAGTWPDPGATRWVRLSDGHYIVERVVENQPDLFRYQVFLFTNAAGRGIDQIVGEQRFVSTDTGTRFEWTYNVLPSNWLTRQIVKGNMDDLQTFIETGLQNYADRAAGL